ncbi:hypothetical protein UFOVP671_18 [uncultured Caudovirales phage]|uniref:Uncharacterized protein n=1 Tax=uncultured Caudovirales phage TaxID=2100421 RepID=A0A6J5NCG1_9CAUD|nr:hypothetical protein UFOVP671_18 [uncultured Caudovirales phage]
MTMDMLRHNGYYGSINIDVDERIMHGMIYGISEVRTYEGRSVDDVVEAFKAAVEKYEADMRLEEQNAVSLSELLDSRPEIWSTINKMIIPRPRRADDKK